MVGLNVGLGWSLFQLLTARAEGCTHDFRC